MKAALLLLLPAAAFTEEAAISVFAHLTPDTDAICSAVAYAWELNARGIKATPYRLGDLNPETEYVLKAIGIEKPALLPPLAEKQVVAITDTNNPQELPENIDKAQIHSIVDHHKMFGGIKTDGPIEVDIRALCSAGSILYSRAKARGLTIPKDVAGCMLSALLSDSLGFRSPTTTEDDKVYAQELAKIAGLDVTAHTDAMLEAKAQISHLSPKELCKMDSKVFTLGGKKIRVSVLELTNTKPAMDQREALVKAQQDLVKEEKLDDMILFVVDIIKEAAVFIGASETATKLVEKAWKVTVDKDSTVVLPGVLSRKKQMIPKLEAAAGSTEL
eukprot:gnl/TRDRNA2_/TRDRNA2_41823_c0_seq1.p1 gnl/TRDRNA2_/TRDRNA2_41823_c0~~gnl/TRDRNA2_/TRDRNA2_41823_c0_seq1.p1  ORF type:complete len:357 (-),score=102.65 gnl/TRDRNA2_/TRDRNA2_41823_c0_seq1:105-1097(-)